MELPFKYRIRVCWKPTTQYFVGTSLAIGEAWPTFLRNPNSNAIHAYSKTIRLSTEAASTLILYPIWRHSALLLDIMKPKGMK